MANLSISEVAPVKVVEQFTAPAGEAITKGQAVRFDTSTGYFTKANGSAAGEARIKGIALETVVAGQPLTAVVKGILDLGDALDALTYDDDVYLSDTDGTLADSAGTVSVIVGETVPGLGHTTPDKLLRIDL